MGSSWSVAGTAVPAQDVDGSFLLLNNNATDTYGYVELVGAAALSVA